MSKFLNVLRWILFLPASVICAASARGAAWLIGRFFCLISFIDIGGVCKDIDTNFFIADLMSMIAFVQISKYIVPKFKIQIVIAELILISLLCFSVPVLGLIKGYFVQGTLDTVFLGIIAVVMVIVNLKRLREGL